MKKLILTICFIVLFPSISFCTDDRPVILLKGRTPTGMYCIGTGPESIVVMSTYHSTSQLFKKENGVSVPMTCEDLWKLRRMRDKEN